MKNSPAKELVYNQGDILRHIYTPKVDLEDGVFGVAEGSNKIKAIKQFQKRKANVAFDLLRDALSAVFGLSELKVQQKGWPELGAPPSPRPHHPLKILIIVVINQMTHIIIVFDTSAGMVSRILLRSSLSSFHRITVSNVPVVKAVGVTSLKYRGKYGARHGLGVKAWSKGWYLVLGEEDVNREIHDLNFRGSFDFIRLYDEIRTRTYIRLHNWYQSHEALDLGSTRPHKGVKASANSDIMYFFTSAQDGDSLQDDVRLCLSDDLKKAQDHYPKCIVVRNKVRLVAHGYTQEEGIDYDDVFAPVARIEVIRLFLAYVSFMNFVVYEMDVKSAFLYGKIEEEVYVCQPLGFEDPKFPNRVYKVKGNILLVQIYVDDIIFESTKKELCTEFEKLMHKKFQMSSVRNYRFDETKETSNETKGSKSPLKNSTRCRRNMKILEDLLNEDKDLEDKLKFLKDFICTKKQQTYEPIIGSIDVNAARYVLVLPMAVNTASLSL
ncbi:putative ribonuclease H-like domain-containing protein [Tanacetum coccineum]